MKPTLHHFAATVGFLLFAFAPAHAEKIIIQGTDGQCMCIDEPTGCGKITFPMMCSHPAPSAGPPTCPARCKSVDWLSRPSGTLEQRLTPGGAAFSPGPVQNCYFPPCNSQPEFPFRGNAAGLEPRSVIAVVNKNGQTVSMGGIQPNGDFTIPPPLTQLAANGPHKICILRPSQPIVCGPAGNSSPVLEVSGRHIPIRMLTGTSTNIR